MANLKSSSWTRATAMAAVVAVNAALGAALMLRPAPLAAWPGDPCDQGQGEVWCECGIYQGVGACVEAIDVTEEGCSFVGECS